MGNVSRTTKQGKDGDVRKGIASGELKLGQLPLGGRMYTPAELDAFIQSRIDAGNAVVQAKAAWLSAIRTYEELDRQADIVVRDLRNLVIGAFGETSPLLAQFGFSPPKRTQLTAEQKKAAVLKRNETRKARKTMGRKQKAKIKGVVPAPAVEVVAGAAGATVPTAPGVVDAPGIAEVATTTVPTAQPTPSAATGVAAPAVLLAVASKLESSVAASPAATELGASTGSAPTAAPGTTTAGGDGGTPTRGESG